MGRRRVSEAKRHRDFAIERLRLLSDATLEELDRRAEFSVLPDGFPATTGSESGVASGQRANTPVEGAALRRLGFNADPEDDRQGRPPQDGIVEGVFAPLAKANDILRGVIRARDHALSDYERPEGRASSVDQCEGCGRDVLGTSADHLRGNYCDACRKAWERAGRPLPGPERERFNARRRAEREAREEGTPGQQG